MKRVSKCKMCNYETDNLNLKNNKKVTDIAFGHMKELFYVCSNRKWKTYLHNNNKSYPSHLIQCFLIKDRISVVVRLFTLPTWLLVIFAVFQTKNAAKKT